MRGSRWLPCVFRCRLGIIPAHAGLTVTDVCPLAHDKDHPRACGAHILSGVDSTSFWGSSPRMRGSLGGEARRGAALGIIPAHAGLTLKNPNIDAILSGPHPVFYSFLRVIR